MKRRELDKEIESGRITINEARRTLGLSPVKNGDAYITRVRSDSKQE